MCVVGGIRLIIIYGSMAILILILFTMFFKVKIKRKKKKRIGCPTCSSDGRCTQGCKKKLGDFY
jgi:hypothetical protein